MKHLKLILSIVTILGAGTAQADQIFLRLGESSKLGSCGGTASLVQKRGHYVFSLNAVEKCSNLDLGSRNGFEIYETYKVPTVSSQDENGPRSGSYTLPTAVLVDDARNTVRLRIRSNKAAKLFQDSGSGTWDEITLEFGVDRRVDITLGEEARLPNCGGTVEIAKSKQGNRGGEQLNVILRNVENCSDFVWEDLYNYAKNEKTDLSYDLQRNRKGEWGGSYTLSWDYIKNGKNRMSFYVSSNSGKTLDRLRLGFIAIK